MFIRTENFRTFLRLYPIVSILVTIHFLLWVAITLFPGGSSLLNAGIGFNFAVAEGEYWRLLTSIFFHGSFGHALFNSFSLVLFGPYLELLLRRVYFILFYLASGIVANIATFYLEPLNYFHLGASGAIFGLFGLYVYLVLYRKDLIDRTNSQIVITILAIGLLMTFMNSNINIIAHLFGLIGGAALSPIILKLRNI